MRRQHIPLASQLIQELARGISQGTLVDDNGRLPSEAHLAQQFDVSRATVREALAQLERAGVVSRKHGVGTFVRQTFRQNPGTIWGWLDQAPAFVDLISQSGHKASCELLKVKKGLAGKYAGLIDIDPETTVVHIGKIFHADDEPVIYSSTVLPFEFVAGHRDSSALKLEVYRNSIYEIFQKYSNKRIDHQSSEISATLADGNICGKLRCALGAPILMVEEVGYTPEHDPLFHALHFFHGDRIRFRQIRVPTFIIEP